MPGRYEIYKTPKGDYRFRLKASNGECILTSQNYKSKRGAKNGEDYFVLKAANHQIIGTSEMYNSASSCGNGIKSVGKNAGAKIEDFS